MQSLEIGGGCDFEYTLGFWLGDISQLYFYTGVLVMAGPSERRVV